VVRNDFLDCMMELRKRGNEDSQETNLSVKNPKNDATFRKLTVDFYLVRRKKIGSRAK
jgi:hypothetical protein